MYFPDICQIRLDFVTTSIGQPSDTGVCTAGDNLVITPGAGDLMLQAGVPVLCGDLTGQHGKYIHI